MVSFHLRQANALQEWFVLASQQEAGVLMRIGHGIFAVVRTVLAYVRINPQRRVGVRAIGCATNSGAV